jgi:hypothetical protein
MSTYGCAVTSAAMILKYHNVNKTSGNPTAGLPSKELTPKTLNVWLKSRPDEYVRNGLTNFAAIANMTKEVHEMDPTSPNLEYVDSDASIETVINSGYLPLLKLKYSSSFSGTHFVVATDKSGSTYSILDPRFPDRTTLDPHYPNINRIDHFEPTNSDFSYFILVTDPSTNISLKDENDNDVGNQNIEEPLADLTNETNSGAQSLKILYFKQPPTGAYTLEVSATTSAQYTLDTYVYNQDGDGDVQTTTGVASPTDTDMLQLNFDPEASDSASFVPQVSYTTVKNDFKTAYTLEMIKQQKIYEAFYKQLAASEKLYNANRKVAAKTILKALLIELKFVRGKSVTEEGYRLLKRFGRAHV